MNWREESQRTATHQDVSKKPIRSSHRKPPSGFWQQSVPSWEKQFCTSMYIPWRKLCETKKVMCLYESVVQWNDSAGEEAFCNAKKRFWAKINGLPCDISLPDSDIYIDKIDWNSSIDPDLLIALDQETVVGDAEADGKFELLGNGLDSLFLINSTNDDTIRCTGWGDANDVIRPVNDSVVETIRGKNEGSSWDSRDLKNVHDNSLNRNGEDSSWNRRDLGNADDNPRVNADDRSQNRIGWGNIDDGSWNHRGWEDGKVNQWNQSGWVNGEDNSWNQRDFGDVDDNLWNRRSWGTGDRNSWIQTGRKNSKDNLCYHSDWGNCDGNLWKPRDRENVEDNLWSWKRWEHGTNELEDSTLRRNDGLWQSGKGSCGKRDGLGRFGSRYSNSRLQSAEEYRINGGWRNCRGRKRTGFGHEGSVFNERALVPGQWN